MHRRFLLLASAIATLIAASVLGSSADTSSSRGAITINSNADFASCGCVTAGTGTASDPYVIGPFAIATPSGGTNGWAVKVDNSKGKVTAFFTITGISIGYNDTIPTDPVIWLVKVMNPTTISNISANNDGTGIELDSSSNITLDSLDINKGNGPGVVINGSSFVSMSNSKLKATAIGGVPHTMDGLYAVNSSNLTIGGLPACPNSQPCNVFDYDSGFGIYLQNSQNVTISHASANADDTGGYVLDGTNYVDLGFSTGQGSGPICVTLNGQKVNTGYFSDLQGGVLLINGAQNSSIHDDVFAANTGLGIGDGGNGFFFNACTDQNQPFTPEAAMGGHNTFANTCYANTDVPFLPASNPCK
jgi:parallel beta-helix repeat protein